MDEGWTEVTIGEPPSDALVLFYMPPVRYLWATGLDFNRIMAEFPAVTHWKVVTREPPAKK